ncbi:MAG TPA: ornithine decarboxylase, partial [Bacillota bacterium]|nr:ornithine decarboxylase [Bacillota bacterium]
MDGKMPLVERLVDHAKKGPVSFHVPGHKGNSGFLGAGASFFGEVLRHDLTELPGLDNLHSPAGVIRDAQRLAAKAYGADYTYFLVNGSTVGLLASMLSATRPGDTVMVDRGCHSSVFNGLVLGRLKPVYLPRPVDPATGIPLAISPERVERGLGKAGGVKAVIITNPTYYGICSDIKAI